MQMLQINNRRWIFLVVGLFAGIHSLRAGDGGGVVRAMAVLDGSRQQIQVDSSRTVQDSAFFNPAYVSNLDTSYSVQNVVTVKINESSLVYLRSAFQVVVKLRIIYTNGGGSTDSVDRDFTVKYDSAVAYGGRTSYVFNGGRKVTVKVISVTSNASGWDPVKALMIENQLVTRPKFAFSCTNTIGSITTGSVADTADELPVSWTAILGADQYDLEWTYIDTSALRNHKYGNPIDLARVFLNNASRTTITGTSYNIPLLYDDTGTLFIRVRPVQAGAGNSVIAAGWSSDAASPVYGRFVFMGHQRAFNWQSNISYAEEGKRKMVVQYFDGSLRSRQTVTKDNKTNTTLVAETYYDYQGRPAVQVMPSPSLHNTIQYTSGFNVSFNSAEYSQSNFDSLTSAGAFCSVHADPMDSASGASQYYSASNPTKTQGMNQFIPSAFGYPFTETEYTPDNTGRISRQSGVGPDYQLGTGHETKYYYGTPDQRELDALFGTEVGDRSHYFKNMVRDANGQYSVSYVDMHGRTIATALAGASPSGLSPLASNVSNSVTETLADSNSVFLQDQSMTSQKSLLVPITDTYQFHYALTPDIFQEKNCNNTNICYTCRYDLEITIADNCNNQLLPGAKAFDTVVHNFTLGGITNSCNDSAMSLDFSLTLGEGSYVITKKLTANKDAYNYYRDSVYLPGNTCSSLQQVIDNQKALIAASNTQCTPDCATCRTNVGDWVTFQQHFMTNSGVAVADTAGYRNEAWAAYQSALSACDALCQDKESDANDIRSAMLQDLTPPFGQYADTAVANNKDVFSIFYQKPSPDDNPYVPIYKLDAITYLDGQGKPDSIYNDRSGIMVDPGSLSVSQFAQNFRSSWAEALLPYHPEYCKLLALQAQNASSIWDRTFEAVDDYSTAAARGYLNPTGKTDIVPFSNYTPNSGYADPLFASASAMRTAMENKMRVYQPAQGSTPALSLWALASIMVKCDGANNSACALTYASNANGVDFNAGWCVGEFDMAWRYFRRMYQELKHDIMFQYLLDQPKGCSLTDTRAFGATTPTAAQLYTKNHLPHFTDSKTSMPRTNLGDLFKVNSPTTYDHQVEIMNDSLQLAYRQNSEAYAQQWAQQLSACTLYTQADLDAIISQLTSLCFAACDTEHPLGASSLPAGRSVPGHSWRNFQDIISQYNQAHGISDDLHCNAEMVTIPAPYDKQPAYSAAPVYSRPTDCECTLINGLYTSYLASVGTDASFSAYLLRTQHISMSDADLTELRNACAAPPPGSSGCQFLSHQINLPPAMQCNTGAACVSCSAISALYTNYTQRYPGNVPTYSTDGDTVQEQKNRLFQNYMNNHLGFGMQTWEYLAFMDTCAAHASDTSTVGTCQQTALTYLYRPNGTNTVTDIHLLADSGYIMAGSTTAGGTGLGGVNAYAFRTNKNGNVVWSKVYGGDGADNFAHIRPTSDSGFIAVGSSTSGTYSAGSILVVKMNANGEKVWTRKIGLSSSVGGYMGERGFDIVQTHDGGYAVAGMYDYRPTEADLLAVKLDSTGATSWIRRFGTSTSDDLSNIIERGDTLLVSGYTWDTHNRYYGVLYKLNSSNGSISNKFYYQDVDDDEMSMYFTNIYPTDSGYNIATYNAYKVNIDSAHLGILRVGYNGSIFSNIKFDVAGSSNTQHIVSGAVIPSLDGGVLVGTSSNEVSHIVWQKLNGADSVEWSVKSALPGSQSVAWMQQRPDSTYIAAGIDNDSIARYTISSRGAIGCYDTTTLLGITRPAVALFTGTVDGWHDDAVTPEAADTSLVVVDVVPSTNSRVCYFDGLCPVPYHGPLLCGKSEPLFPPATPEVVTTCTDSSFFAVTKGSVIYNYYRDSLTGGFEKDYLNRCMQAYKHETFTVTHSQHEYHYTLYYYDQAGNLIRTVAPAGVAQNTDTVWLNQVVAARVSGTVLVPAHTLVTDYRYNTLNQVVAQHSPDGGMSKFWYDRLGRLAVSQNARQALNNQYSYTQYDTIGRIVQVGQLVSSTAITDVVSRSESSLQGWLAAAASTRDQITVTTYDDASFGLIPALSPRNIRNRVAWTALYNTNADLVAADDRHAAGTYYSYDILGNVDTLVQDFKKGSMSDNGNRLKKIIYDFDLVSGKVNRVGYQAGAYDAFYHRYVYDAENRITNVETSADSINWDNDAFYSYYAHGPLARTILGEQQVQGINYAYTLQGWMKGINPEIYTGGAFSLRPDSSGNVVAASAYNLLLNYHDGDYRSISPLASPDQGVSTSLGTDYRPLFTGNISSMGMRARGLSNSLLYNYQYDQLNRLVAMDAWNRTGAAWSAITKVPDFKENISYDPNGNILGYKRNGNNSFAGKPLDMDSLGYKYIPGTNRLDHITDNVSSSNYPSDIDGQAAGNYKYDSIGQLISDAASGITNITWTVYGKIATISKSGDTLLAYTYDAGGNRVSKSVIHGTDTTTTWYVRDAQGNVLSVYTYGDPAVQGKDLTQTEAHIYGSSRLGILKLDRNVERTVPATTSNLRLLGVADSVIFTRGNKLFELTNHLGNVLVTISDKRYGVRTVDDTTAGYFIPDVVSANDYYPFGSLQPGRSYAQSGDGYRYGFNGKENDNEVKGEGNEIDYGMRVYDPRIGKFLSVDPLTEKYPWYTPYQFAGNKPIKYVDLDGAEEHDPMLWEDRQYLAGKMSEGELRERRTARGLGAIVGGALVADYFFTGGSVTKTTLGLLSATQFASAFEHNRARTPEGRKAQDLRSKRAVGNGFLSLGIELTMAEGLGMLVRTVKFIPTKIGKMSDAHWAETIKSTTRFGEGEIKTVAKGGANIDKDLKDIFAGQANLENGQIVAPSGRTYGVHTETGNVYLTGGPGTVTLTKAEFSVYTKMQSSGGLKDDALKFFEGLKPKNAGISEGSQQKLIDLYNSANYRK